VKLALRRLFKSPAFALTAIMTVGAAIGANALIFSVVRRVRTGVRACPDWGLTPIFTKW